MTAPLRSLAQILLGSALVFAGTGHLTFARREFRAQVPPWVPLDVDTVVLLSGVVEIALGVALLAVWRQPRRAVVGLAAAALFVAVFPGNIAQLTEHRDAFGLDTDRKRVLRLFFQPVLIAWALWATDAISQWRRGGAARPSWTMTTARRAGPPFVRTQAVAGSGRAWGTQVSGPKTS